MDEQHAHSVSDEVGENWNKFRNNKAKGLDRFL